MTSQSAPDSGYKFPAIIHFLGATIRGLNVVAPALAATLAYRMWFVPGRTKIREGEAQMLASATASTTIIGGKKIALYTWGEGPVIVMAHGWASRASRLSAIALALADRGYTVIAFDAPANGESGGRTTSAVEIGAIITQLSEQFAPIAGIVTHSFGGTGLGMAIRGGLKPPKVVCISPPADARRMINLYLEVMQLSPKLKERIIGKATAQFGADIWDKLTLYYKPQEFNVPALIIHDKEDAVAPYKDGVAVANGWPQATLHTTTGLGHRRILRDFGVIAQIVTFFGPAPNLQATR